MKEAHITVDPRTGLFDPQPLRTFRVWRGQDGVRTGGPITVLAHMASQTESGALILMVLRGGLPFVVHGFAPGQWCDFDGTVPTEDEIRTIKSFSEREQAITAMLANDRTSTRQ